MHLPNIWQQSGQGICMHCALNLLIFNMTTVRQRTFICHYIKFSYLQHQGMICGYLVSGKCSRPSHYTRGMLHQADMIFTIHSGIVNIHMPVNITSCTPQATAVPTRRRHDQAYRQPFTRVDVYGYSMFPRTIQVWNNSSYEAVTALSSH